MSEAIRTIGVAAQSEPSLVERAVSFPEARPTLVGVLTKGRGGEKPAVVFLNSGLLHRIGPNRLYVRLAREAALRGLNCLRFDRSGIGDSPPRTDGLTQRDAALRDVQDAFEFLSTSAVASSFVLFGLCSGADLAFRVALADKRVAGVVLVDGLPYGNVRSRLRHRVRFVRRELASGGWRRLLSPQGPVWRRLGTLTRRSGTAGAPSATATPWTSGRDIPPKAEAEAGLCELVARGVKVLVVYTEARGYNYSRQFADLFPRVPAQAVQVEYLEGVDHLFCLIASQDRFVRQFDEWITRL